MPIYFHGHEFDGQTSVHYDNDKTVEPDDIQDLAGEQTRTMSYVLMCGIPFMKKEISGYNKQGDLEANIVYIPLDGKVEFYAHYEHEFSYLYVGELPTLKREKPRADVDDYIPF